jgi:hypothetical protein
MDLSHGWIHAMEFRVTRDACHVFPRTYFLEFRLQSKCGTWRTHKIKESDVGSRCRQWVYCTVSSQNTIETLERGCSNPFKIDSNPFKIAGGNEWIVQHSM